MYLNKLDYQERKSRCPHWIGNLTKTLKCLSSIPFTKESNKKKAEWKEPREDPRKSRVC